MGNWQILRHRVLWAGSLCAIAATLAGCASGHQKFFKSAVAEPHPTMAEYDRYNIAAYAGEPRVHFQHFDDDVGRRLHEDGFALLGVSSFNGVAEDEGTIKRVAKSIGAEVVIAESRYSHTVSGAVPITTHSPQTFQSSGTVQTSSGNWATYSGTTTGTVSQTRYMPYSVARYDQSASFWARTARPRILGATASEMTQEDRQKVGANQGIRIVACARDSPAWAANILAGDFILAVNAQPIDSAQGFVERLLQLAGQTVTLSVMRGAERRDVVVALNPNPMRAPQP